MFDYIERNSLMPEFIRFCNRVRKRLSQNSPYFTERDYAGNFLFYKKLGNYIFEFGYPSRNLVTIRESDFKSGDWLEAYAYYKLKDLKNIEIMAGVKIVSENGIYNELDLVVLKDFKLTIISCKSGKVDNQYDLFQLETIRNIASGTFGRGIFVTANDTTTKFLKRAEELSINVIKLENQTEIII